METKVTNSAHTPGPWTNSCGVVIDAYNNVIGKAESIEHADLIARAPDLLAENERLRAALAIVANDCLTWKQAADIARAALVRS